MYNSVPGSQTCLFGHWVPRHEPGSSCASRKDQASETLMTQARAHPTKMGCLAVIYLWGHRGAWILLVPSRSRSEASPLRRPISSSFSGHFPTGEFLDRHNAGPYAGSPLPGYPESSLLGHQADRIVEEKCRIQGQVPGATTVSYRGPCP